MPKILVVDDQVAIGTLYAEELTQDGYEVISTSDCKTLVDMIHEHKPDVVALDIRMGEYDGLNVLQDIRKVFYNMPVILCTAYPSFKHDLKSNAADYYVVKSSDLLELKAKINIALEGTVSLLADRPVKKMRRQGKGKRATNRWWKTSQASLQ